MLGDESVAGRPWQANPAGESAVVYSARPAAATGANSCSGWVPLQSPQARTALQALQVALALRAAKLR